MKRDLRLRLHLAASPALAYGWLATDAGRARWWAERSEERDGLVELHWSDEGSLIVPILVRHPPSAFALRWFGGSAVHFALRGDGGAGTDLDFSLLDVPDERWGREQAGWPARLLELKAACEFGVDLRNHDPGRTPDRGYVDG